MKKVFFVAAPILLLFILFVVNSRKPQPVVAEKKDWDQILKESNQDIEHYPDQHQGETLIYGLKVGMPEDEIVDHLKGGKPDPINTDAFRFPMKGNTELYLQFEQRRLAFAFEAPKGTDSFNYSMKVTGRVFNHP